MVRQWVKDMTEEVMGVAPIKIGDRVKHPDGRTVEIVSGTHWGEHGLSNHWGWKETLSSGELAEKIEYGYGWTL